MLWDKFYHNPQIIKTNSFFNQNIYFNKSYNIKEEFIKNEYLKTNKYQIYLDKSQDKICKEWFDIVDKTYNYTNNYIKKEICNIYTYLQNNIINFRYKFITNETKIKETLNFINLRNKFKLELDNIKGNSSIYKHTIDYAVKLCIEMYKSCYSNYKANNIKSFNIKDLLINRRRFNLVLEPSNFNKKENSFAFKTMKKIKSNKKFKNFKINHNVILQYDNINKTYYLLIPKDIKIKETLKRDDKCGIDIGVRTFMTIFSNSKCIELGSNICNDIDKINKNMDKIKSKKDKEEIKNRCYEIKVNKLRDKLKNKIEDLHKKTCNYLLKNYKIINIGNVSTKSMVSNLNGNLKEITKRRLYALKHYKFREYLKLNSKKYNTIINEIDEYMTSKTCYNCKNIKRDLGSNKIYNCLKCNSTIDRDINASINIWRL